MKLRNYLSNYYAYFPGELLEYWKIWNYWNYFLVGIIGIFNLRL